MVEAWREGGTIERRVELIIPSSSPPLSLLRLPLNLYPSNQGTDTLVTLPSLRIDAPAPPESAPASKEHALAESSGLDVPSLASFDLKGRGGGSVASWSVWIR